MFNGNELGILLADWAWTQYKAAHPDVDPSKVTVINTTVSSKMLAALAKAEGLYYEVRPFSAVSGDTLLSLHLKRKL